MKETGIEQFYRLKDGKKLRMGYTTGTCAAAATKAAVRMLVTGQDVSEIRITTPKGIALDLEIEDIRRAGTSVSCAVRKYSGDDPDVTNGILVYSTVTLKKEPGIEVDGGTGVGRVTKPGLKQGVGEAAINPVPRRMITQEAETELDDFAMGLKVVISIPEGEALASRTFNPRLGITGGISVLGTSGIVEPMSEAALVESLGLEIKQKYAMGQRRLIVTPGNYGADFLQSLRNVEETRILKCGNYIGQAIDMAAEAGFQEVFFISHIGKFIKVAGGIMNTHSKEADGRAEIMTACAIRAGADLETAKKLLDCLTTDEMLNVLRLNNALDDTMQIAGEKIDFYLNYRAKGQLTIGTMVYSNETGVLYQNALAEKWMKELEETV